MARHVKHLAGVACELRVSGAPMTCPSCRGPIPALRSTRRFCSNACRQAAYRNAKRALEPKPALRYRANGHRLRTLGSDDWYSPPEVVDAARRALGQIDLDPASCAEANAIVQASRFYTAADDGLRQAWTGRIWLNSPFARLAPKFAARFAEHWRAGAISAAVAVFGTHHMTTRWFGALAELRPLVCVPDHRLKFSGSTARPAHGSAILGIGIDPGAFEREFAGFGPILSMKAEPAPAIALGGRALIELASPGRR
jgi:DNA N-6-adenine-methyltransferase (Dam)